MLGLAVVAASVLPACTSVEPTGSGSSARAETPVPTIVDTVLGVCVASSAEIQRLDRAFDASAATTDLVGQGTILATLTGVIATDLERMKSVAPTTVDPTRMEHWLAALQAVVDSGVAAVRASSESDVTRFQASAAEMERRRGAARDLARSLGYGSCPY